HQPAPSSTFPPLILAGRAGYSGGARLGMVTEAEGYARSNQDLSPTTRPGYLLHNSRSAATPAAVASASSAAAGQARPGWPGLPRWWSVLTAFAAGLALAGAFPPFGFWPLASAGPALLILA